MMMYARLNQKRARENISILTRTSNFKENESDDFLIHSSNSKSYRGMRLVTNYESVSKYLRYNRFGGDDLCFRLPSIVHDNSELKYIERSFHKALDSIRSNSHSLYKLMNIYITKVFICGLEHSIGGLDTKKISNCWISANKNWQEKDFQEILIFLFFFKLAFIDDIVNPHFKTFDKNAHDFSVRPEIVHKQNECERINFHTLFAMKALFRYRYFYGDERIGEAFIDSKRMRIIFHSYLNKLKVCNLTHRGNEIITEIKS